MRTREERRMPTGEHVDGLTPNEIAIAAVLALCFLLLLLVIGFAAIYGQLEQSPPTGAVLAPVAIAQRVGQWLCGFRGHSEVLHFEGNRVCMQCTSCGRETRGWTVVGPAPRQRFEGDPRRHELKPQLVLVSRKRA